MAHQQSLAVGTELIGDFRIMDLLGSGGFANTYLAMDLTLGREVAIKEFFPSELAVRADSQSVSVKSAAQKVQFDWAKGRFVREAKTLAKFRHPSVVRVFRVFNANDTAYIVLEFVRGANMETWLKRIQRRPDQDELDHFLPPLLDALEVVHEAGILHRDIKPANIYIREAERTPVLLDFGAAKYATTSAGEQTATTAAIVSKGYSPHEAYSTEAHLQGPWTDIYGLAATIHRSLTGSAPMESTTRILQDDFVALELRPELADKYRPEFLSSLTRALAVMPKDRPQSIAEWRAELYPHIAAAQSCPPAETGSAARAGWHPLSDTPSDATTIYTGGSSRPSQVAGASTESGPSRSGPSRSRSLIEDVTAATVAARPALERAVKNTNKTVLAGWLLALSGAIGLAAPFLLPDFDDEGVVTAARTTPTAVEQQSAPIAPLARGTPKPQPAVRQPTPGEREAEQRLLREARAKELEKQRAAEAQREIWRKQRLALQADLARKRSEEASKLAHRRAEERRAKEEQAERARQAKLAEEKRQREEQARLAAKRAEEERLAAEKTAAEKAEQERRAKLAEEKEKQRLAAEAKERADREKAAAEAREQERLRMLRRAEAAERARKEREAKAAGAAERQYAALDPAAPATPVQPKPAEIDRKAYNTKVQTALKEKQCYSGTVDGDAGTTETALDAFKKSYDGEAKPLNLKTAAANDYDAWLTWFRSLEKFGCIQPRDRNEVAKPTPSQPKTKRRTYKKKVTPKKSYKAKSKPKQKRVKKKSASRKRPATKPSYGAGSTSRNLLRGTR